MAKKKAGREELGGDALRRQLRENDGYLQYRRMVKNIQERFDIEKYYEETHTVHAGRRMRNLFGTTPGADKISDAVLQDVKCRSRLVEIVLKATRHYDRLDILLSEMRKYLAAQYPDVTDHLRTKAERQEYFDAYLKTGIKFQAELKSLIEAANFIIKDIDQCSHATRHLVECLSLVLSRASKE